MIDIKPYYTNNKLATEYYILESYYYLKWWKEIKWLKTQNERELLWCVLEMHNNVFSIPIVLYLQELLLIKWLLFDMSLKQQLSK